MYTQIFTHCYRPNHHHSNGFYHKAISLKIVYFLLLAVALGYKAGLISSIGSICMTFNMKNPFATHWYSDMKNKVQTPMCYS